MGDRLFIRSLYMMSTINPWGGEVGSPHDEQLYASIGAMAFLSAASSPLRRAILCVLASARFP